MTRLPTSSIVAAASSKFQNVRSREPVEESQILAVPSDEEEMIQRPSGLNAQALTQLECPDSTNGVYPVLASQTLSVLSSEAETIELPSGVYPQALTPNK